MKMRAWFAPVTLALVLLSGRISWAEPGEKPPFEIGLNWAVSKTLFGIRGDSIRVVSGATTSITLGYQMPLKEQLNIRFGSSIGFGGGDWNESESWFYTDHRATSGTAGITSFNNSAELVYNPGNKVTFEAGLGLSYESFSMSVQDPSLDIPVSKLERKVLVIYPKAGASIILGRLRPYLTAQWGTKVGDMPNTQHLMSFGCAYRFGL